MFNWQVSFFVGSQNFKLKFEFIIIFCIYRTLQHQPVTGFQGSGIKVEKQDMTRQRKPGQQDQNFQSKVEQYLVYLRFSLDGGFAVFPQVEKRFPH